MISVDSPLPEADKALGVRGVPENLFKFVK